MAPRSLKDPLAVFERWSKMMPRAELGGLLKEYVAESNHNGWDCWDRHDLTGIRKLFEDVIRYHDFAKGEQDQLGGECANFATKQTTTNPVD